MKTTEKEKWTECDNKFLHFYTCLAHSGLLYERYKTYGDTKPEFFQLNFGRISCKVLETISPEIGSDDYFKILFEKASVKYDNEHDLLYIDYIPVLRKIPKNSEKTVYYILPHSTHEYGRNNHLLISYKERRYEHN